MVNTGKKDPDPRNGLGKGEPKQGLFLFPLLKERVFSVKEKREESLESNKITH